MSEKFSLLRYHTSFPPAVKICCCGASGRASNCRVWRKTIWLRWDEPSTASAARSTLSDTPKITSECVCVCVLLTGKSEVPVLLSFDRDGQDLLFFSSSNWFPTEEKHDDDEDDDSVFRLAECIFLSLCFITNCWQKDSSSVVLSRCDRTGDGTGATGERVGERLFLQSVQQHRIQCEYCLLM